MRLLHSKFLHLPSNLLCHTGVSGLYLVLGEKVQYIHHLSCFFPVAPLLSAVNIRAVGRLLKVERLRVQEYAFGCEVVEKFFEHTHNDAVQTNRRVKETSIIEGSKFKFQTFTNALLPSDPVYVGYNRYRNSHILWCQISFKQMEIYSH